MTNEDIIEFLEEFPLLPPFSARVPTIQEPANYGSNLETSVYEGQIRSCYRIPMHPFALAFCNHYKMAFGQLVPYGWRKLVGLIYLVQTLGYQVAVHDFMRLYLEAYCYSSQRHDMFEIAREVARNAEREKRESLAKINDLEKKIKTLKAEKIELFSKASRLEKRCEKFKKTEAEVGDKAILAILEGTTGDEWLRKRTEDGLEIFEQGFQKAKELTLAKYPNLSLDDIVVPTFGSPSGETAAPTEARDAVFQWEKSVQLRDAYVP
ncbi:hypothetical protein RJ640_003539 [Escallonia rubra]|uniref:Uncharacterized protein n=1 Tax=Escallonia rubra TaxID=112253 RepID=A0AA88RB03_9ASTE|nr:hypothetical protein RJ640_003539 [Escallonia rubra]